MLLQVSSLSVFTFHRTSHGRSAVSAKATKEKKGMGSKETLDEKGGKSSEAKFCCLLTSRLVYLWSVSEKQSRPATAEPSVASHFCGAAGDRRAGETESSNRLRKTKEEETERD